MTNQTADSHRKKSYQKTRKNNDSTRTNFSHPQGRQENKARAVARALERRGFNHLPRSDPPQAETRERALAWRAMAVDIVTGRYHDDARRGAVRSGRRVGTSGVQNRLGRRESQRRRGTRGPSVLATLAREAGVKLRLNIRGIGAQADRSPAISTNNVADRGKPCAASFKSNCDSCVPGSHGEPAGPSVSEAPAGLAAMGQQQLQMIGGGRIHWLVRRGALNEAAIEQTRTIRR